MADPRLHIRGLSPAGGTAGQTPTISPDGSTLQWGSAGTDPETVRDIIGAALVAGANVTITVNDAGDTITISAATDPEVVRDTIAATLVAGANVTITTDDAANTITISAAGGGGGSGGGGVLASKLYNPSTDTVYNTTSSTMVDIDATNLAVTFTAPASGAVIVTLSGLASMNATGSIYYWGLRDAAGLIPDSTLEMYYNTILPFRLTGQTKITGLTPGNSYTWKWAWMRAVGTATLNLSAGKQSATSAGPAMIRVEAA